MKRKTKLKIKFTFLSLWDKLYIFYMKRNEIKKFKDQRRKNIYSKVELTPEQKNKIDELYKKNYGKKIPYTWHKHYTAFTGNFDENYFPELLYIPEFEYYMNMNKSLANTLEDKNILPIFASYANIKMPNKIVSCQNGLYKDKYENILTIKDVQKTLKNIGDCFYKPTIDTSSGVGCKVLNIVNGIDSISKKKISELITTFDENFVIQERIICHESIRKIYSGSVNTFRIMTYRWNDEIIVIPAIMRIGQNGSFLDNAHAGGMFIAIDNDGTLHKTAYTEFKTEFTSHPDTNVIFENYKIELFPKVIEATKKMHQLISDIGIISWDMTIDQYGDPVLIESNIKGGGIWMIEMAHGIGPFGDKTAEILRWMKFIKNVKYEERKKYLFGKMK